jgi:predicted dehydrogenase
MKREIKMPDVSTKTLRWGILSTANIATTISRAINASPNTQLLAIASRDLNRAQTWATEHGAQRAYGSYDELLTDPDIDAVYIPLPPSMHAEWTIKAAANNKHVLCEKPLALNLTQAQAMVDACQANNVQLMDGVMWVHHQRTHMMKAHIDNGDLGPLRRVTVGFSFNWDEIPTANIRTKSDLGGGSLGDLGYYCARAILWALQDMPTAVYATARYVDGVDFNLSALLWFADQRMASFDCSFDTVGRRWFEIAGTTGSLVCDDFVSPQSVEKARYWLHGPDGKEGEYAAHDCLQVANMIETFTAIVQTGQLDPYWPQQALETTRICQALSISAQRQERVELNAK